MKIENLEDIRGVGEKIRDDLISYFGSEEGTLKALEQGEYERLIVSGVPFIKTVEIARFMNSSNKDFEYSRIVKTKEGREVLNNILKILISYPKTEYGKIGISLFYPTQNIEEIKRRQNYVEECCKLSTGLAGRKPEIIERLSKIKSLQESNWSFNDLIATENPEIFRDLEIKIKRKGNLIFIESLDDVEYLKDFEYVRYVASDSRFIDKAMELGHVEPIYEDDIDLIVPEMILNFFSQNKETILTSIDISKISRDPKLQQISKDLLPLIDSIKLINRGTVQEAAGGEMESLKRALDQIDEIALRYLEQANESISVRISNMSIQGKDLLKLLKLAQNSSLIESLPKDIGSIISGIATEHESKVAGDLFLDHIFVSGIYLTDSHMLEIDTQRLEEIKRSLTLDLRKLEFELKHKLAKELKKHITTVKTLIREVMEYDLKLALGSFTIEYGLTRPSIQDNLGIGFENGKNIFLKDTVQPVNYILGKSKVYPDRKEKATIITGANSGGKTTLLELIAQTALMTHMGLWAPADSISLSLFDEIHCFGKGKGTDAGAFETLLKTFENITRKSKKKRLILADEIEAITEPGAAAKVLAAILEWFKEDENTLITIVTHLGEDIKDHVGEGVRIDGIEAKGLDNELNLVVDRNPKLGEIAKSTPELIVERLSKKTPKKGFYQNIMERFKD